MKISLNGLLRSKRTQSAKGRLPDDLQDDILVLARFLDSIPCIEVLGGKRVEGDWWWVKFRIDPASRLSWYVVMELGHILNYFALNDPLPTVFKPVAPPPQGNDAGLDDCAWVIECFKPEFSPIECATVLRQFGPSPASSVSAWEQFRRD